MRVKVVISQMDIAEKYCIPGYLLFFLHILVRDQYHAVSSECCESPNANTVTTLPTLRASGLVGDPTIQHKWQSSLRIAH